MRNIIFNNIQTILDKPFNEINIQQMPEPCIIAFQQAIKYADSSSAMRLANILLHFQVYEDRCYNYKNGTRDVLPKRSSEDGAKKIEDREKNRRILDWAILLTLTNDIYEYSRAISNEIPQNISIDQVKQCLRQYHIGSEDHSALYDLFDERTDDMLECDWNRESLIN